ncbi:MAG TPA: hypothetical protein VGV38_21265 [Pyrinomonadaceae bacterium]|nr:hypothetical protein [Pyrinomonadaceae bacterium]
MKLLQAARPVRRALLLSLCVLCAPQACVYASARGTPQEGASAREASSISVEGVALTGPFSLPQRRAGRLYLPLLSVARALGDQARVDASARTVEVRRQTGVVADFDASLRQVRENGSPVLVLADAPALDFPPQPEALMLPQEVVSALLDASIQLDETAGVVRVTRSRAGLREATQTARRRGLLEVYGAEYEYNLDRYPTGFSQNLTLRSAGRFADARFNFLGNLSGSTGAGASTFRTATLAFERAGGQRFALGDFGTGTDLTYISSTVRGAWAQLPARNARVTAFFGRSVGGQDFVRAEPPAGFEASPEPSPEPHLRRQTFDTNTAGAYVTFGPTLARRPQSSDALQLNAGFLSFDGPARQGRLFTGALRASSARFGLRADAAAGVFEGSLFDGTRAKGTAAAADVSGFLNVRDGLTLQGQFSYAGRNFLHAQAGAGAPLNLKSLGLTWRPHRRLTLSAAGTSSARADVPGRGERLTTASASFAPARFLSNILVSHTRTRAPHGGTSYTLLNATRDLRRWHLFLNASSVKGPGLAYRSAQGGASLRLGETGSLQLSQSFGSRGALGGAADWWSHGLLSRRLSLGAGLGYTRGEGSPLKTYERVNVGARLPFGQTLQVSYGHLQSGPQINFSLRGPLFSRRESRAEAAADVKELNTHGSVSGRVYQDLNFDGRYDPGVDRPQAGVRVRVDGNLSVETDREGLYRVARAQAGEHTVALDLLSVRADLTILGGESQTVLLRPGYEASVDFRTVRTGRVAGAIWLDLDGDGAQGPDEPPLADVRVVTAGGRDTLTDEQGAYVIGDLPPGQHLLLVDLKTLPENTLVRATLGGQQAGEAAGSLQVSVRAGAETGGINFAVRPRPAEIKRF